MGDREEREDSRCTELAGVGGEYELRRLKQEEFIWTFEVHVI